jgi:hypothetical protein
MWFTRAKVTKRLEEIKVLERIFFPVAEQPNSGIGRLIVEVSRSYTIIHTVTHTHSVGLL